MNRRGKILRLKSPANYSRTMWLWCFTSWSRYVARHKIIAATMEVSSVRTWSKSGARKAEPIRCTSSQKRRGRTESLKVSTPDCATSCCPARFYDTSGIAITLCKVACGLQQSTTTARAGKANTSWILGKVRSICGAKVVATDGSGGTHERRRRLWSPKPH